MHEFSHGKTIHLSTEALYPVIIPSGLVYLNCKTITSLAVAIIWYNKVQ